MYFGALYAKRKSAKNRSSKTWLDGIVMCEPPVTTLYDDAGKVLSKAKAGTCVAGTTMEIGHWEVEVQDAVAEAAFLSGAALAGAAARGAAPSAASAPSAPFASTLGRPFRPTTTTATATAPSAAPPAASPNDAPSERSADPAATLSSLGTAFPAGGAATSAVRLDPFLLATLRPHQLEGVRFMYESVMGLRRSAHSGAPHFGCLLAHEPGTGKTLQVVALLWTLLKQGPRAGHPAARKAVVACPASLVGNWGAEFRKWLGGTRLEPLLVEGGDACARGLLEDWALPRQRRWSTLVASYETLRTHADLVASCTGGVDVLVCDEAHRLKNARGDTQTLAALRKLRCDRRVLLSGTPVQNDLGEFFAVVDFACPGLLGERERFRRIFAAPIERSREKGASEAERTVGAYRSRELGRLTAPFVHRASAAEIHADALPPKTEYVVFCRLTPTQAALYAECLKSTTTRGEFLKSTPLTALQRLQRLCNSATLFFARGEDAEEKTKAAAREGRGEAPEEREARGEGHARLLPADAADPADPNVPAHHPGMSGKLAVLARLLARAPSSGPSSARSGPGSSGSSPSRDRFVVVSGFTSTLDVVQAMCESTLGMRGKISRLDGSVAPNLRTGLVKRFNEGRGGDVFLLSCKAGGVGLNLVGANRLVLFDSDWNPANDLQALARVWREGQTKPVVIYRLLSTGTVEEKVFQRQILKGDVANAMGYASASASASASDAAPAALNSFSKAELRDLFKLNASTASDTVDALRRRGDRRGGGGAPREIPEHWRRCGEGVETGADDPPLADAARLTLAGGGETIVSAVCKLPSAARAGGGEAT